MLDELDYLSEAKRQIKFKKELVIDGLHIPKVYEPLCNKQVLVQSWEEGVYFDEVLGWDTTDRILIARTLLMILWKSIFVMGEVHGDPHIGNCYYRKTKKDLPEVVLLDFGCTVKISRTQRLALLKLILALRENKNISPIAYFSAMGFDLNKLAFIEHELPALSRILLKPFLTDEPFDVNDWKIGRGFELILQKRKWWFRSAGASEIFLLMRAFQGVVHQLSQLGVHLPWWALLEQAIGASSVAEARSYQLPDIKKYVKRPQISTIAGALHVEISQGNEKLFEIVLPPDAALDFKSIVPEAVFDQLKSHGWDDIKLQEKLLETRLAAQEIFNKKIGDKAYKIWLQ